MLIAISESRRPRRNSLRYPVNVGFSHAALTNPKLMLSGSGTLGSIVGKTTVTGGVLDLGGTTQTQNGGLTLTGDTVQDGTLSSSGAFDVQAGTICLLVRHAPNILVNGTRVMVVWDEQARAWFECPACGRRVKHIYFEAIACRTVT